MSPPHQSRSPVAGFAPRASVWKLHTRQLDLAARTLVMGILNVTPDSFSDGGLFETVELAVAHGRRLVAEGADILDIGGESTRPYSEPVSESEELRRVIPVVGELAGLGVPISIDTSKSSVALAALAAGAEIINDITALTGDKRMIDVARHAGCGLCVMHMQGTPQTMQVDPRYGDVVAEVFEYLRTRRDALVAAGIEPERIALDPGIGFGKTHEHNLELLRKIWRLHELGQAVLVGHSRKGFIAKVIGERDADLTAGTIGVALALARQGVQIVRVHDVLAVRQALALFEAAGGAA